jgi:hypothetical protein
LTTTQVSRDIAGNFNHVVIQLTDADRLARCPFIMLTEPGGAYFDEAEAAGLRTYLQKGGFLWADDFWGEYAWAHWENEIRKALPSGQYPLMELPLEHPLFHVLYDVHEKVQIGDGRIHRCRRVPCPAPRKHERLCVANPYHLPVVRSVGGSNLWRQRHPQFVGLSVDVRRRQRHHHYRH